MKKQLFAAVSIAAMMCACTTDDAPPSPAHMGEITFSTFTDPVSRIGEVTLDNMTEFQV